MATANDEGSETRTVTPLSKVTFDGQMNAIGYIMAVLLVIVLLPLLPVAILVWLIARLFGR